MKKQFSNLIKLIVIMYISISLKNILQILLGTFFNCSESSGLINLKKILSIEALYLRLKLILIYDFVLLVFIAYFWIYFLLYLFAQLIGNKLWFHIGFMALIYLIVIISNCFDLNILFIFLILGYANWWMFKKWIKLK